MCEENREKKDKNRKWIYIFALIITLLLLFLVPVFLSQVEVYLKWLFNLIFFIAIFMVISWIIEKIYYVSTKREMSLKELVNGMLWDIGKGIRELNANEGYSGGFVFHKEENGQYRPIDIELVLTKIKGAVGETNGKIMVSDIGSFGFSEVKTESLKHGACIKFSVVPLDGWVKKENIIRIIGDRDKASEIWSKLITKKYINENGIIQQKSLDLAVEKEDHKGTDKYDEFKKDLENFDIGDKIYRILLNAIRVE